MAPDDLNDISREELVDLAIELHGRAKAAEQKRDEAERQLRWFKKQLFGTKSERRIDLPPHAQQLCLGESLSEEKASEIAGTPVQGHTRRRRVQRKETSESGLRFNDSVPIQRIEIHNPELEGVEENEQIQITERITYRLAQQPASYKILEIVRRVIKRKDTGEITCPPAPPSVLEKSYADVSLLAGMLVDKCRYHLPLYRQHQRMKAAGITVSRGSLSNWAHGAIELVEPIYRAQFASVLESGVLTMDETPIRAGRKAKGKMKTGYFWPIYGDRHEVVFPFASSRAHKHVKAFLGEYEGTLLSDGYAAYPAYAERREKVEHALCWAHTRRAFIKAEEVEPVRTARALDFIGLLYKIEAEIQQENLEGRAKLEIRGDRSRQVAAEFFEWLKVELIENALLPKNPFTVAAHYALDRRRGLEVFLSNPDIPIDTNHLERALCPIPMGKKNWLFCWTELGAERLGQIQSLLATCVLHDVDPYVYLVDVLQRIESHPQSQVAQLTPRLWKEHFAKKPMRSAIDPEPG